MFVDDLVEIKEAGLWDALLAEGLDASAAVGVVWHKPCCAEGNDTRVCTDGGRRVLLQGLAEFAGGHEIGG